jgi:hypothetical protein
MTRYPLFRRSLALVLLLVIPSCSRQSSLATQPDLDTSALRADAGTAQSQMNREPGDFYPLAVGNQWTYELKLILETVAADGSQIRHEETSYELQVAIDCATQAGGYVWFIERIHHMFPGNSGPTWRVLRQDRDGLHALERLSTPDPCAGLPPLEGARRVEVLRYPLRPGSTWVMQDDSIDNSTATATVEAHEVIETPAGRFPTVRIRIENLLDLPNRTDHRWYGRDGLIAIETRSEAPIAGGSGAISRSTTSIRLTSLHQAGSLAGRIPRTAGGPLAIAPAGDR